ncbi:MAG TPA: hypothetical protein VMF57_04675 [Solirubrobacteraceae bacterium]|nr:hypothetical protein [Solirubrobacteraceae bacterium]
MLPIEADASVGLLPRSSVSFFDETEETRTAPRQAPRRRRPAGGGGAGPRRPRAPRSTTSQAILVRRIVLAVIVVVAIVLIAVLVNSCEVSARNSSLKDYNNNVAAINAQSISTGQTFFGLLSGSKSNPTSLQSSLAQVSNQATNELKKAKGINVPDEVKGAQTNFVLTLQMRADGINNITAEVPPALQSQTSQGAVNTIASEMARFYASDVTYKDYTVPEIIGALRAAGITVGGLGGQQVNSSQFLPSIEWLNPTYVASQLNVTLPAAAQPISPGTHGHALNTVSVGGSQLTTGATNSIPSSPAPTFTLSFDNSGQNTENNVVCKVTIKGSKVSGQTVVPQTKPGQSYTCNVTLSGTPPLGSQSVTAEIVPVPGEKNTANNFLTFPVDFQ